MNKNITRVLKILALILAVILIVVVCWFANALCGNPISEMLAWRTAETWLKGRFSDSDYYIEDVKFNIKDTNYLAHYRSKTSIDTQFTLSINMFGQGYNDTYDRVLNGSVTARRLIDEYSDLTDQVFNSNGLPYNSDMQFGLLEIFPQGAISNPLLTDVPDYALIQENLVIDKIYDIRELGSQAGHLVVYVDSETVTYEAAARIVLQIRSEFDKANIPFHALDLILRAPRSGDDSSENERIRIAEFLYDNIYEDGLEERIKAADAEYKNQDAQKK